MPEYEFDPILVHSRRRLMEMRRCMDEAIMLWTATVASGNRRMAQILAVIESDRTSIEAARQRVEASRETLHDLTAHIR